MPDNTPTPEQIEVLRFMLGATAITPKKKWGYRNRAVVGEDHADFPILLELERNGWVKRGTPPSPDLFYFTATPTGCIASGLHQAALARVAAGNGCMRQSPP